MERRRASQSFGSEFTRSAAERVVGNMLYVDVELNRPQGVAGARRAHPGVLEHGLSAVSGASFRVDNYQRKFSWERRDVATLILDLYKSFSSSRKTGDGRKETAAYKPYFLGPYVYVEAEDSTVLVDGQQRMTTLHLLLIHLYRLLDEAEERVDAAKVANLISTVNYGETTFTVSAAERRELLEALFHGREYELPPNPSPSVRNLAHRARDLVDDFRRISAAKACSRSLTGC